MTTCLTFSFPNRKNFLSSFIHLVFVSSRLQQRYTMKLRNILIMRYILLDINVLWCIESYYFSVVFPFLCCWESALCRGSLMYFFLAQSAGAIEYADCISTEWFGLVLWRRNHFGHFMLNQILYIYIKYMIFKLFVDDIFKWARAHFFFAYS